MQQRLVCQQFNQNFLKSPPSPVKGAPGPFAAFLRLFPLLVGLHSRLHLFRAKDPLDTCIVGGYLPQYFILHLHLHQADRQPGDALPHPDIVS